MEINRFDNAGDPADWESGRKLPVPRSEALP